MTDAAAHAETIRRVKNELAINASMLEGEDEPTFAADIRALVALAERAATLEAERLPVGGKEQTP